MNMKVFGVSTGDTGQHGIGDIIESTEDRFEVDVDGNKTLDDEPVFHVFKVHNNEWGLVYLGRCWECQHVEDERDLNRDDMGHVFCSSCYSGRNP